MFQSATGKPLRKNINKENVNEFAQYKPTQIPAIYSNSHLARLSILISKNSATINEHQVLHVTDELLNSTPETITILYIN